MQTVLHLVAVAVFGILVAYLIARAILAVRRRRRVGVIHLRSFVGDGQPRGGQHRAVPSCAVPRCEAPVVRDGMCLPHADELRDELELG
jgi:hypothetical protein